MSRVVPDLVLERIALGEIDGAPWGVASDDARLAAIRASNTATLAQLPPPIVAARVNERFRRETRGAPARRALMFIGPATLAAAAALLLIVDQGEPPDDRSAASDVTIIKGIVPALAIYSLREGGAAPLAGPARPGDRIQLATLPAGRAHGVVVSIDGRGGVSLHFPEELDGATDLGTTERRLPHSFELDDAPAFERFVFVTSAEPIDVAMVLAAARAVAADPRARAAALALPGLEQWSRVIDKVVP